MRCSEVWPETFAFRLVKAGQDFRSYFRVDLTKFGLPARRAKEIHFILISYLAAGQTESTSVRMLEAKVFLKLVRVEQDTRTTRVQWLILPLCALHEYCIS